MSHKKCLVKAGQKNTVEMDTKFRIGVAVFILFAMLCTGGVMGTFLVAHLVLISIGGIDLVFNVWQYNSSEYLWVVFIGLFVGGIGGAWLGVWFWAELMRKTRFISDRQTNRFSSGF